MRTQHERSRPRRRGAAAYVESDADAFPGLHQRGAHAPATTADPPRSPAGRRRRRDGRAAGNSTGTRPAARQARRRGVLSACRRRRGTRIRRGRRSKEDRGCPGRRRRPCRSSPTSLARMVEQTELERRLPGRTPAACNMHWSLMMQRDKPTRPKTPEARLNATIEAARKALARRRQASGGMLTPELEGLLEALGLVEERAEASLKLWRSLLAMRAKLGQRKRNKYLHPAVMPTTAMLRPRRRTTTPREVVSGADRPRGHIGQVRPRRRQGGGRAQPERAGARGDRGAREEGRGVARKDHYGPDARLPRQKTRGPESSPRRPSKTPPGSSCRRWPS